MDQSTVAVIGTTVTAIVAVVGWAVSHVLTSKREIEAKQREVAIKYVESQIAELYGPLFSLTQQIFNAWGLRQRILADTSLSNDKRENIRSFFYDNYFKVFHARMHDILTSKLYLAEGDVPESFYDYMAHSQQQLVRGRLQNELGIATPEVEYVPWPQDFDRDVRTTFEYLVSRLRTIRELSDVVVPHASLVTSRSATRR